MKIRTPDLHAPFHLLRASATASRQGARDAGRTMVFGVIRRGGRSGATSAYSARLRSHLAPERRSLESIERPARSLEPQAPQLHAMLNYRLLFLIVGIAAGVLGFGVGSAGGTATTFAKLGAITCFVLLIGSYVDRKY